jgi:plasmid stabilization system protein ParE
MPYQVQVGAQLVEFPDSVNPEEAQRILADQFPPTGEDVAQALQNPDFVPTREQFDLFKEYNKTKQTDWINTIAQSVDAAASMMGSALAEGATGAAANPLNYIEGAAQGTRQLYGLVAQSENPDSPLFKFKDLVTGTGTPDSQYNQFLEARDFARTSRRLEQGQEGIVVPPEFTNPEFVQGVSMIADPTMLMPGIGEVFGAGKLSARAVGKGAQLAGRAVTGVARPLERFAGAAERMTAEALGMTPEGLRTAATTAGVAGALGIAPELATAAAIPAGIRTAREVGEAITAAGENLMTQPSRIGPLEAIGAATGANLRQRMLGVIGQYGGDAAVDAALRGTAGGLEGAVLGTGLGYLSGGEEGAAAGLGSGAAQGALGALGGRAYQKLTGKAAAEARAGDLGRFIEGLQDPTTKGLFERVRDTHGVDAASALMDVEGLVKGRFGDVDIKYLSDADFVDQYKGRARGVQVEIGDRPTIVINADILGKGKGDSPLYTLGHELFHALEKSEQLSGGATEIKNALVGRWIQEGDVIRKLADGVFNDAEIEARFNEYRDKLAAGNAQRAAELAQFDTINKKADYIASELAAEHFAALIAGQKPDAMLKGFSGLTRQLLDAALTQNASKAIANAAAAIERTFGVKPTDSVLFPDLKQASPQVNAMLRDLVRARRKLDEKIMLDDSRGGRVLKPEDISNPLAAKELVDLGLAEQMPDGSIRNLSSEEIRARDDKDLTSLRSITEQIPGARLVDGEITGRFSPEQLSAIEQSQTISSRMKDKIRAVNLAMENGNSLFVTYFAALRRVRNRLTGKDSPKYSSGIKVSEREFSPYSFWITKADNPVVRAIDITKVRNELSKLLKKDGSIGGLWSNTDGFMTDLARYFTNLDQREGARRSAEIFGVEKAKFLGDFVGAAEKSGSKFVRSFRLDRVGSMTPMDFKAKFSEEAYQLSKQRWMPAETIGDKLVTNSDEGYRIVSGAKHRLYGPDGKLIGIYDTQTQAERKADATQARLQPEVDQQQRVPGDEGRQTAEAGGGNRALGGAEGGQEGRQADRTVRQAGDVRFMPDGTSDGLAVLDDQLKLELPARPKVLDIANAFQKLFGKAIEYRKAKPQDNARLVGLLVQEIDRAVKLHPEAKGWYDENVKLTMDVMRELDPDIAKPENDFIFKAILAATSDGNKVGPQFQQTWKEYSNWKNTGEISGEFVSGDRIENIQTNLEMLNEMIKDVGWEKTKDFMVQKGTVKELRQALMDVFGWTKKQAQSIGSSELADEVVPFAVVLGPKLGSFFNNLYGDFSSVTMDRWFMRTLGRLTGTQVAPLAASKLREMRNNLRSAVERLTPSQFERLGIKRSDIRGSAIDDTATTIAGRFAKKDLRVEAKRLSAEGQSALEETRKFANALKKGLNPLVEAPVDGTHRRWIRERIAEVQKELRSRGIELENADLQAVLWYLEKELYEKLKYRSKSGESDYASAASSLYQSVAGRPSDVYAGGTGRVRAIGSAGGSEGMGASQASQASGPEVGGQRFMPVDENTGLPLNPDKTVTVYHHTNKTAAEAIRRTGVLKSAGEPDVYVTTEKSPTTGYGDEVVAIKVDPKKLQIDDQFPDGRTDFRLSVGKPGGSMKVAVDSSERFMPVPDSSMPGAYSFTGGYRALPGKSKGSLRIYSPAGSLIGIAASLDEAQRIIRKKARQ